MCGCGFGVVSCMFDTLLCGKRIRVMWGEGVGQVPNIGGSRHARDGVGTFRYMALTCIHQVGHTSQISDTSRFPDRAIC